MDKKTSSKTPVLVAVITGFFVIIAAIISSPNWFKYFFPDQFVEQEIMKPQKTEKDFYKPDTIWDNSTEVIEKGGTEKIVISKIELCPISSKIPAYFLLEFKNEGTKDLKDLSIFVDLGKAEYQQIEFQGPNRNSFIIDTTNKNIIGIKYPVVRENESYIIYALLSMPAFKSIIIDGSNLKFAKEYSYKEYIASEDDDMKAIDRFIIFLVLLAGAILIVFTAFFVRILYTYLARNLGWDRYFKN